MWNTKSNSTYFSFDLWFPQFRTSFEEPTCSMRILTRHTICVDFKNMNTHAFSVSPSRSYPVCHLGKSHTVENTKSKLLCLHAFHFMSHPHAACIQTPTLPWMRREALTLSFPFSSMFCTYEKRDWLNPPVSGCDRLVWADSVPSGSAASTVTPGKVGDTTELARCSGLRHKAEKTQW